MSRTLFDDRIVLITACVIGSMGVMIFAILPFLLNLAANTLHLDDTQVGFLGSSYVGGYTIVTALSFFWITRINWRHVFGVGILLLVSGLAVSLHTADYSGVLLGLAIAGAGAGFMYALSVAIISEMHDADRKFGIKMIPEQGISALLLFVLPVLVIARWGFPGLLITLIVIFLTASPFIFKVPPHGEKQEALASDAATSIHPAMVFAALLGLLLFFGGIAGIWAFMERFASQGELDPTVAGQLLAVGVVSSALGPVIPALIGDRFGRVLPLMLAAAVVVLCLLILSTPLTLWKYGLILVLLPAAWYAGMAWQMGIIAETDVTGRFSVLISAALGIGATLGPAILGVIKSDAGLPAALGFAGVVAVGGALASIAVVRYLDGTALRSQQI